MNTMIKRNIDNEDSFTGRHYPLDLSNEAYEYSKSDFAPRFAVIGIGTAGANYVDSISFWGGKNVRRITIDNTLAGREHTVDFAISLNTENYRFGFNRPDMIVGDPRKAVADKKAVIKSAIGSPDMVFIISGLEEAMEAEATRVTAGISKKTGALTILLAVVPSPSECQDGFDCSEATLSDFKEHTDVIFRISKPGIKAESNGTIRLGFSTRCAAHITGILHFIKDLMARTGVGCLDWSDIKEVFSKGPFAEFAVGRDQGKERAKNAARSALNVFFKHQPSIKTFDGALVAITGPPDFALHEVDQVENLVRRHTSNEIGISWRAYFDETLKDDTVVSIVLTGITWKEFRK